VDLMKDAPRRTTSVQWPAEVDAHLDLLVRLAAEQGVLVSRAQMLSALVADASLNGPTVGRLARRYLGQLQAGDLASRAPTPDALPAVRYRGRQRGQPS
jgi:hypothetical protein